MAMSLKQAIDIVTNSERYDFYAVDKHSERRTKVKFYNDGCDLGDEDFYLLGMEYGPTHLIQCRGESNAYEIWCDELPPVPMNEVHEAYNAFDRLVEFMEKKGHENDLRLRQFCFKWDDWFFAADTKNANETGAWDRWKLDEAYAQQSNSTDSGIVYVGHYAWINEADLDCIEVELKAEVAADSEAA